MFHFTRLPPRKNTGNRLEKKLFFTKQAPVDTAGEIIELWQDVDVAADPVPT